MKQYLKIQLTSFMGEEPDLAAAAAIFAFCTTYLSGNKM
jgi:hypothetical protein